MSTVEAVVTKVLDVRAYRHFWITHVEVLSEGAYRNINITTYSEREARDVKPGDTAFIWGGDQ